MNTNSDFNAVDSSYIQEGKTRKVGKPASPKENKGSSKLLTVIFIVFVLGVLGYCGISGMKSIIGCANAGQSISELIADGGYNIDYASGKLYKCSPYIYSIEHSIDGALTYIKEYYYVMYDDVSGKQMIIRAPEDFDMDYFPDFENPDGIEISGRVLKADYKVTRAFNDYAANKIKQGVSINCSGEYYLDITAVSRGYKGISVPILAILAVVLGILAYKTKQINRKINSILTTTAVLSGIASLIMILLFIE